jgi:hypothetical protein
LQALSVNRSLKELYLNDNEIGDDGVEALAASVKNHESLSVIDLSGNKMSDKGAAALASAIPNSHELDSLMLSRNSINDEGAAALASLLEHNPTICRVQLQGNNISDKGVAALAQALKANKSVTELDLSSNNVGNAGALEIRKLLDVRYLFCIVLLEARQILTHSAEEPSRGGGQPIRQQDSGKCGPLASAGHRVFLLPQPLLLSPHRQVICVCIATRGGWVYLWPWQPSKPNKIQNRRHTVSLAYDG